MIGLQYRIWAVQKQFGNRCSAFITGARACAGKAPKATGDVLHATTVGLFEQALRRIAGS